MQTGVNEKPDAAPGCSSGANHVGQGSGKSTVLTLDTISPITRVVIHGGMPRRAPILDADEDTRRRRAVVASGRQCAPMMIAEDLEIWLDGQRSNRACGLYVWGRV